MDHFVQSPGDTPLRDVPDDYSAGGEGRWYVLPDGPDAGKRMFFLDKLIGRGSGPVILFVHGNPECSYTYRKVIAALGEMLLPGAARVIAMDHIGFGRSDQASFEMVDMHHADNLAHLVAALDLREITLVVHDWGGPIGIGALLRSPERVANLVVLNSTIFPMPPEGLTYENFPIPVLLPWSRTASFVPDRLWGAHSAWAVTAAWRSRWRLVSAYSRFMVRELRTPQTLDPAREVFRQQFGTAANARSSKRNVRQTPVWGHGYVYTDPARGLQDNRTFYRTMQDDVAKAWGPSGQAIGAALVCGTFDPLGKDSVLDQWRTALPQISENVHAFEGEGHFIEEHRPAEIAAAIAQLIADP